MRGKNKRGNCVFQTVYRIHISSVSYNFNRLVNYVFFLSQVAEMLKILRSELFELLEEKIRDPCLNLLHHQNGKKIISTIVHIVTND